MQSLHNRFMIEVWTKLSCCMCLSSHIHVTNFYVQCFLSMIELIYFHLRHSKSPILCIHQSLDLLRIGISLGCDGSQLVGDSCKKILELATIFTWSHTELVLTTYTYVAPDPGTKFISGVEYHYFAV